MNTGADLIFQDILKEMYEYNHQPDKWDIKDYAPGSTKQKPQATHEWGGGRARRLLWAAYTVSLLCLLRFDEVLKIQAHEIELVSETCIKLTLPFRKTSQFGGKYLILCSSDIVCTDQSLYIKILNHSICGN